MTWALLPTVRHFISTFVQKADYSVSEDYSVGAFGDSAYEYLLKQWLLTGKTEPKSRDLCNFPGIFHLHSRSHFSALLDLKSAEGIINNLLFLSPKRKLLYVTDLAYETPTHAFEHLSCFLPGLLALGAHTLDLSPKDKELHQWAAEGLAYTCYITYADQATKLGPDVMIMDPWTEGNRAGTWVNHLKDWEEAGRPGGVPPGLREVPIMGPGNRDYGARKTEYLLRPEASSLMCCLTVPYNDRLATDGGELLHSLEDNWRCTMASERVVYF